MGRLILAVVLALVGQSVRLLRDGESVGAEATRCLVVRIHHVVKVDGSTCAAFRAGEVCLDPTHWAMAVGMHDFAGGALTQALDQIERLVRRDEPTSSGPAAHPSTAVVLCAGKAAPSDLMRSIVERVVERCHAIGVGRIVKWDGDVIPNRIVELHVALPFDAKTGKASRRFGGDEVKSDEELTARVKAALASDERERETVTIVTIDAAAEVDRVFAEEAAAACRRAGEVSVEIVRSRGAREGAAARAPAPKRIDPATAGTISGTVRFEGTPPPRLPIDPTPECAKVRSQPLLTEDLIVTDGKVQNAFLQLDVPELYAPPAEAAELEQKGCLFVPHVLGIQAGQPFMLRNGDPFLHNYHTLVRSDWLSPSGVENNVAMSKPGARPFDFGFDEGIVAVKCDLHPWSRAWVVIVRHPFFAVSTGDGRFTIRNVPPGEYDLVMHHEKQPADQRARVKVTTGTATTQDFVLKP
jgi:hypothetical protein